MTSVELLFFPLFFKGWQSKTEVWPSLVPAQRVRHRGAQLDACPVPKGLLSWVPSLVYSDSCCTARLWRERKRERKQEKERERLSKGLGPSQVSTLSLFIGHPSKVASTRKLPSCLPLSPQQVKVRTLPDHLESF